jgi:FkbM family methyltransferase
VGDAYVTAADAANLPAGEPDPRGFARVPYGETRFSACSPLHTVLKGTYRAAYTLTPAGAYFPFSEKPVAELFVSANGVVIQKRMVSQRELVLAGEVAFDYEVSDTAQIELMVRPIGNAGFSANACTRTPEGISPPNVASIETGNHNMTYSQAGEDVVVKWLFYNYLGLERIRYLEIGTNDPVNCNNTYMLYRFFGCTGVCVEPDPTLIAPIRARRERDTVLNVGISASDEPMTFCIMDDPGFNSASEEYADKIVREMGRKVERIIEVPTRTIDSILDEYFPEGVEFVSIDTEGMELEILKSMDFEKHRPLCLCVETVENQGGRFEKTAVVGEFLREKGYEVYADTFINTIFWDRAAAEKRLAAK